MLHNTNRQTRKDSILPIINLESYIKLRATAQCDRRHEIIKKQNAYDKDLYIQVICRCLQYKIACTYRLFVGAFSTIQPVHTGYLQMPSVQFSLYILVICRCLQYNLACTYQLFVDAFSTIQPVHTSYLQVPSVQFSLY